MTETDNRPTGETSVLHRAVADLILATPGVVRLEPTIGGIHRTLNSRHRDEPDGVLVNRRGRMVDVRADVAIEIGWQARQVARDLRDRIVALINSNGLDDGQVEIGVLSIERSAP